MATCTYTVHGTVASVKVQGIGPGSATIVARIATDGGPVMSFGVSDEPPVCRCPGVKPPPTPSNPGTKSQVFAGIATMLTAAYFAPTPARVTAKYEVHGVTNILTAVIVPAEVDAPAETRSPPVKPRPPAKVVGRSPRR